MSLPNGLLRTDSEAPAAPSPPYPAGDGAILVCASCGQENALGSDQCARPGCRKTLPGNGLSRRTGLHAAPNTPELRAIEEAGRTLFEQSVIDAGGREELAARELAQHEYRAVLDVNIRKLALALEAHGMFDRRGRLRVGWITKLESLIATAVSIDKMLTIRRRARQLNVAERFAQFHGKRRGR